MIRLTIRDSFRFQCPTPTLDTDVLRHNHWADGRFRKEEGRVPPSITSDCEDERAHNAHAMEDS
jgi:hypothetical protein